MHSRINFWLNCLICLFLPFGIAVAVFIIIQIVNWLIEGKFREKFSTVRFLPLLLFTGLYIIYIVGMVHTQNADSGWFDLQVKLSIFIFPVLLFTRSIDKRQYSAILLSFIAGNVVAAVVCLATAVYNYLINGQAQFFYGEFSLFLHPSYYAMYINFCIVILLVSFSTDRFSISISKEGKIAFLIFFSCIVFLLSSKAGLITLGLIYTFSAVAFVIKSGKYLLGSTFLIVVGITSFILLKNVPEVGGRFKNVLTVFQEAKIDKTSSESNSIRILVWQKDIELIKQNFWIGVGTGDVKDELLNKYKTDSITGAYSIDPATNKPYKVLNAHSQFFQTAIAIGVIGFLFLIIGFIYPATDSFKHKNYLYLSFLVIIALNFLTESMLETQAGVLFYAFFNALLYRSNRDHTVHS